MSRWSEQPVAVQYGALAPHTSPHLVQFEVVPNCTLQPSEGKPQACHPELQTGLHDPPEHEVLGVCAFVAQVMLQPPQFNLSVPVGVSQPLARLVSQSAFKPAHCGLHALLTQ